MPSKKRKLDEDAIELFPGETAANDVEASMREIPSKEAKREPKEINKKIRSNDHVIHNSGSAAVEVGASKLVSLDGHPTGLGLFAKSDISEGDHVCWYVGKKLTNVEVKDSYSDYILLNCDAADYLDVSFGPYIQVTFFFCQHIYTYYFYLIFSIPTVKNA